MLTATSLYRAALPYPHRRVTRVEAFHGPDLAQTRVADWLPVVSGSVQANLAGRVTRQMDLKLEGGAGLFPETVDAVLSPYRAVLRVSTGIGYPDGSHELFPVFVGRVAQVTEDADGGVSVQAYDLAADVIGFRFERPRQSSVGATVTAQIRALIADALPDAVFGTDDVDDAPTPSLVWDEDRGQALDDLAAAVSGRWYALGDGSFVTRRYPYTSGTPVLELRDDSGGVVMTATRSLSRDAVYNSVTVASERMDGSPPIRVTLRNTTTGSPTQFGDDFGRVSTLLNVQTPLTTTQANSLANQQLSASQGLAEVRNVGTIPDATLEPGDTVRLAYRGSVSDQVIDTITYPLGTDGEMRLTTRASVSLATGSGDDPGSSA